jgi:phage terminase small subunit
MARRPKFSHRLTLRQTRAIDNYLANGGNKCKALKDAGYSKSTAEGSPQSVFRKPAFVAELEKRQAKYQAKVELTQEWVTKRLMTLADSNHILAKFKKIDHKGQLSWDFTGATLEELAAITELTTEVYMEGRDKDARPVKKIKIGTSEPHAALVSLGRHLGMFHDKVEVTGGESLVSRLQRGRARASAKPANSDDPEAPAGS